MRHRQSPLLTIGATAVATAALTIFARNFISGEKKIKRRIAQRYGISDPQFERSMSQLLGPPILDGNLVRPLRNGVEIFPAMLEAIRRAERTHHLRDVHLLARARSRRGSPMRFPNGRGAGVKVHVLMDGIGCNCVTGPALRQMEEAGVELEIYHIANFARTNHRTHRKLLVVDGVIGFTGGVGIADQWDGDARSAGGMAGLALSGGRAGRRADAGGISR